MIKKLSLLLLLFSFLPLVAEAREYPPRWVEMELEEVEDATAYELEFKSKKSGKSAQFKTETNNWKAKIRPGQYEMRLRSYDDRSVPGPWSEFMDITIAFPGPKMIQPKAGKKVASGEEIEEEVDFEWEELEGVSFYRLEVQSGDQKWSEITDDNDFSIKLPVAQKYSWNVYAMQSKEDAGEGSDEPNEFVLLGEKLDEPEIIPPIDKYVNNIGWKAPERAQSYTYMLSRKAKNGKWRRVSRGKNYPNQEIKIPEKIPGGKFRLQVRAEAPNIVPSKIEKLEFNLFEGNRDPASVNENRLKESIEKPTSWYFIASYLISNISYAGTDNQKQWAGGFDAVGGTGRLGIGHTKPGATWGGFGIIDYSGFDLDGNIEQFASMEAHATWKRYFGPNQLRASGGLFYKEIIETSPVNPADESEGFEFSNVSYYGPHIGFDYWKPLSPKLGWQANARLYMSMGGSTPNGADIAFTPSYQFGFMGTYKLSKNIMGFAGYAYRQDSVKYDSTVCSGACPAGSSQAGDGDQQDINLTGHYLNLVLEYGF